MSNKKMHIIILFAVLTVLTAQGCYRKTPEQRAQGIVTNLADKLDLNEAQKTKLNGIKDQFLAKIPAIKKGREETFEDMITLMRSSSIDQNKINGLAQKNKAQADDMVSFIFSSFQEFHDMLTPEQREKAAKEMERWRQQYRKYSREDDQK